MGPRITGSLQKDMLKMFKKFWSNQKGISLVEIVLFITLSSIIGGVTMHVISNQVSAYSFITNTQNNLSDARSALTLISNELLHLDEGAILDATDTSIDFVDYNSNTTDFHTANNNGNTALMRGDKILLAAVESFALTYYDQNNNVIANPSTNVSDIRKIQISFTTKALGNEGTLALTTTLTPRHFIYEDYQ